MQTHPNPASGISLREEVNGLDLQVALQFSPAAFQRAYEECEDAPPSAGIPDAWQAGIQAALRQEMLALLGQARERLQQCLVRASCEYLEAKIATVRQGGAA